jgi:ABC-2 type transport system permease protein
MKTYLKKEVLYGMRNYKFLIIFAVYIFFALFDPLMLKFLPIILADQFGGMDITEAMAIDQAGAIQNFLNTNYQIVTLVIAIALMGLVASEIKDKEIIIPTCLGMSLKKWIVSKIFVYSIFIIASSIIAQLICNIYALTIFEGRSIEISASLKIGLLMGVFHIFILSLIIFFGALTKKHGISAFLALLAAYTLPALTGLFNISKYTPAGLINEAGYLVSYFSTDGIISLVWSVGAIAIIILLSLITIESTELV